MGYAQVYQWHMPCMPQSSTLELHRMAGVAIDLGTMSLSQTFPITSYACRKSPHGISNHVQRTGEAML